MFYVFSNFLLLLFQTRSEKKLARVLFCFRRVRDGFLNTLANTFGIHRSERLYLLPHMGIDGQGGEPNLIYATQALYRVSDAAWNLSDPALAHHLPSETLVKKTYRSFRSRWDMAGNFSAPPRMTGKLTAGLVSIRRKRFPVSAHPSHLDLA